MYIYLSKVMFCENLHYTLRYLQIIRSYTLPEMHKFLFLDSACTLRFEDNKRLERTFTNAVRRDLNFSEILSTFARQVFHTKWKRQPRESKRWTSSCEASFCACRSRDVDPSDFSDSSGIQMCLKCVHLRFIEYEPEYITKLQHRTNSPTGKN